MEEKTIQIAGSITVDELATALGLSVTDLIGTLFKNGIVATINQRLDFETVAIIIHIRNNMDSIFVFILQNYKEIDLECYF